MKKFSEYVNESKNDIKKISKELNKWSEDEIFGLNDDLWGSSDDSNTRDEWNDVKNDLDKSDLIDMAIEMMTEMGTTLADFKDFEETYR